MYQLTLTSRKQLERAALRAQAEKLHIEEVVLGIYKVTGSTGNLYLVGIEPVKNGKGYEVCCSCPTQNAFCKHLAAVMPHYQMREKEQVDWAEIEEAAENAAMLEAVEEMLRQDRLDVIGY